jgi:copper chaperone CopZ
MKKQEFKTNINCSGCVAIVKPFLDKLRDATWSVDTNNPDKVLTVQGDVSQEEIELVVKEAGFEISPKKIRGVFNWF